jgi:hypothetical protein
MECRDGQHAMLGPPKHPPPRGLLSFTVNRDVDEQVRSYGRSSKRVETGASAPVVIGETLDILFFEDAES